MMDQAARLRLLASGGVCAQPEKRLRADQDSAARVFAVTSGKGGVGKTTVAVNLAIMMAEAGKKVLVVDADIGLANVDVMLGLDPGRHIGHLMIPGFDAEDITAVGPMGVSVISGGSGLRELAEASPEDRRSLIERICECHRIYDIVIYDTSPGISSGVTDFLDNADEILLVTTSEPTSLKDTYAAMKTFAAKDPEKKLRLLVNMVESERQAKQAVDTINSIAMKFIGRACEEWNSILRDDIVSRTIRNRNPLALAYPCSEPSNSLRRIARTLLKGAAPTRDHLSFCGG